MIPLLSIIHHDTQVKERDKKFCRSLAMPLRGISERFFLHS
jgi:hypothetical protein